MAPISETLQSYALTGLMRLPLSWITFLTGPARTANGYTLDIRTQWLLTLAARSGRPPLHELPLERARHDFALSTLALGGWPQPIGELVDRTVPGPGGSIPIRIYRPKDAAGGRRGILVYFHGGGWVVGDIASYDKVCRYLAAKSGCILVSVDYRRAPEHRFPAALDDALAAFDWVHAHAEALGGERARIGVGGDSAGGNIAAVLSLLARERAGPRPAFQLLIYPVVDLAGDFPSQRELGDSYLLTRPMMDWFRAQYLNSDSEIADWRVSPLKAPSLAGLPPAYLCTAGFDPLRDEGKAYADRLRTEGNGVIYREFDSLIHGFVGCTGTISAAARAMDEVAEAVRGALAER
ncbi:MAG: alpha/beta hydrolase [Reyranellaceae bacterium]